MLYGFLRFSVRVSVVKQDLYNLIKQKEAREGVPESGALVFWCIFSGRFVNKLLIRRLESITRSLTVTAIDGLGPVALGNGRVVVEATWTGVFNLNQGF